MVSEKGVQNTLVRIENRHKLTRLLYLKGAMTRQELSRSLDLSLPTINYLIQRMEEDGLIYQQKAEQSSGGRIPNQVCFQYDAFYSAGIELTKHHYRVLIMDMKCNVIGVLNDEQLFEDTVDYWQMLKERLLELCREHDIAYEKILGIGLAVPGPAFHKVRKMNSWLLDLESFSFERIEEIFDKHIIIENDANSAGFAEIWAREDLDNAAYLWVSKGVGGAIIRNRKVMHGQDNLSGEFGHMIVEPHGRECLCGRHGCLDRYCSTLLFKEDFGIKITEFFEKKDENEEFKRYWDKYLDYLAIGISNIIIALDVPLIIGGELVPYIEKDFARLKEMLGEIDSFGRDAGHICKLSVVGEYSAIIGAALFPVIEYLGIS